MADQGATGVQSSTKFFCHKCSEHIPTVRDDYTCPKCGGGFIEEVPDTPGSAGGQSASNNSFDGGSVGVMEVGGLDFLQQLLRGLSEPGTGGGGGASVRFQSGPSLGSTPASYRRTRSEGGSSAGSPGSNNHHFSFVINQGPRTASGGGSGPNVNVNADNPMEHMLFTFLNDLVTGLGGGGGGGGGQPVLANFGDYVWGRDGLDAIVTQLMNQMEGTGPPPLATDQIETLPDVRINQEHVDRKLQCSVCWDDFNINEEVKQLECEHLYHPDCIIPWLKLHGTCPICRKDLTGQLPETTPSSRFEPGNPDNSTGSSSNNTSTETSNESSRNSGTTASSDSSSRNREGGGQNQQHSTTNNPSNTAAALLNQFLGPLLMGMPGQERSNTSGANNPSNQSQNPNRQQNPPRDGNPPRGGGGRGGFDNMDMEFD